MKLRTMDLTSLPLPKGYHQWLWWEFYLMPVKFSEVAFALFVDGDAAEIPERPIIFMTDYGEFEVDEGGLALFLNLEDAAAAVCELLDTSTPTD